MIAPVYEILIWDAKANRKAETIALRDGFADALATYEEEAEKRPREIVMLCQGAKVLRQSRER